MNDLTNQHEIIKHRLHTRHYLATTHMSLEDSCLAYLKRFGAEPAEYFYRSGYLYLGPAPLRVHLPGVSRNGMERNSRISERSDPPAKPDDAAPAYVQLDMFSGVDR